MDDVKNNVQTSVKISEEVVATIVNQAISELDGVCGLSYIPSNLPLKSPIKISVQSDVAQIDVGIAVDTEHKLKEVCENVQNSVKSSVQSMTGITVSKVNVYVTGTLKPEQ